MQPLVSFEGTPVADNQRVYVAMTDRREQTATYVACLDAETGNRRWIRYLGAASSEIDNFMAMGMGFGAPSRRLRPPPALARRPVPLLPDESRGRGGTRSRDRGGAVGRQLPAQDSARGGQGSDRDLNPAVVHEGLVIVAPDDAAASSPSTPTAAGLSGRPTRSPTRSSCATCLGSPKGGWSRPATACSCSTSRMASWSGPGPTPAGPSRDTAGFLAGDRIYWPTRNEIQVLDQRTGLRPIRRSSSMEAFRTSGGNLVAADGYLIVAQSDALVVFCQNSRLIERYRDEIARAPDQAGTYYRLARAAEAVGRDKLALESYEQAR